MTWGRGVTVDWFKRVFIEARPGFVLFFETRTKAGRPMRQRVIVQELCESRGGRPGLSVLTSLLVSVDVKLY